MSMKMLKDKVKYCVEMHWIWAGLSSAALCLDYSHLDEAEKKIGI